MATAETVKQTLNKVTAHEVADGLRLLKLGQTLGSDVKQTLRKSSPNAAGTNPSDLASLHSLVLPDDAKAMTIHRAYARAGGGTNGELAVQAPNATPIDGQIALSPAGNIVLLAASAYTDVDVEYHPVRGDVIQLVGSVVAGTGVMAVPAALVTRGIVMIEEADVLAGGALGRKIVLAPAAGAPAAGRVRLDVAKGSIQFAIADAVTRASCKLLVIAEVDLKATLDSQSNLI